MKPKKCKICKETFTPSRPLQMVCGYKCAGIYTQRQKEKAWEKEKAELKPTVYSKEYKKKLQASINKLVKLIDAEFEYKCIDCGKDFGKQTDAGHYHSVGSNNSLRFNLHNIHAQRAQPCNQYEGGKKKEYYEGLINRYGQKYADYIDKELPVNHKIIKLSEIEVVEKLKLVNRLIKEFSTFSFENGKEARYIFNKIIGIY